MTGVDILAAEEVAVEYAFGAAWFWIITAVVGCAAIAMFVGFTVRDGFDGQILGAALALLCLGAIFGLVAGALTSEPIKYGTEYKVTISDEVKMTDFLEKYEIIETEGKIYTVREREADELE